MEPTPAIAQARPSVNSIIAGFNVQDRRCQLFWFLQLVGVLSFLLWVLAISNLPTAGLIEWKPEVRDDRYRSVSEESDRLSDDSYAKTMAVDTWFSLVSMATIDAFSTVFNFNRGLIVTFHRSISLRMAILATFLSAAVFLWETHRLGLNQRTLMGFAAAFTTYFVLGRLIDSIRRPQVMRKGLYAGSLQQYCETLGSFDTSWPYAALLAATIVVVALFSTMLLPRAWSSISVFFWAIFEAVFLTAMKANRTPRYIILSGPILLSIACVKWGLEMANSTPQLAMKPEYFVALFVSGRFILDAHLHTILKSRHELHWARKTVLIPTSRIFWAAMVLLLLEKVGLRIITYSKPIMVLLAYGMSCLVIQTPAIYNVTFKKSMVPRHVRRRSSLRSESSQAAEHLLRNLVANTS